MKKILAEQSKWQLLFALIAGALLPLAFAPFDLFFMAYLAPAVLAFLWSQNNKKWAALTGFCFGIGLFGVGTSWIFVSVHQFSDTPVGIAVLITILFILILAGFIALQGWCYAHLKNRNQFGMMLLAFPSTWVLFEWLRSWLFSGFPWLYLGYSQIDTPLAGFAPIFGVYGLSFLCAIASVLFLSYFLFPKRRKISTVLLILLGISGFALTYINWTHTQGEPTRIALLQGNIDQNLKWNPETRTFILNRYAMLSESMQDVDTLIWPEAAFPIPLPRGQIQLEKLTTTLTAQGQNALIGIPVENKDGRFYNAIVAVGDNATGLYAKRHLVPFGEFLPFEQWIRGMIGFFDLPMSYGIGGPAHQDPLYAGDLAYSPLICYEIVYPSLALSSLENANILLTISNDSWFGKSIGPHQHFQMARMRALELGRYLVRSTNNGITAFVDQKGRIIAQAPQFIATTLVENVYATTGRTPLTFLTHYFVLILSGLFLLSAVLLSHSCKYMERKHAKH